MYLLHIQIKALHRPSYLKGERMKRPFILLIIVFLLLSIPALTLAQEDAPPNSPQDNACHVGGSQEGKCNLATEAETLWAWTCGWYIARYENGTIPLEGVPEWCYYQAGLVTETALNTCYYDDSKSTFDVQLTGPINTFGNTTMYNSVGGTCSGSPAIILTMVEASSPQQADSLCVGLLGNAGAFGINLRHNLGYDNVPENLYGCDIF
jgi:hypothetical protein